MPTAQTHIHAHTPMGATLTEDGATFRVWAPAARSVHVVTDALAAARRPGGQLDERDRLARQPDGTWTGSVPCVADGTPYRYWVVGDGGEGFKRDTYARELGFAPPFPDCDCLVRAAHD